MEADPTLKTPAHARREDQPLKIKRAEELVDPELEARWATRREDRLLHQILRLFLERGGPIRVEEIASTVPVHARDSVLASLAALDEKDLIWIRDGQVDLAYPFSAAPTAFVVRLVDGRERFVCCAIDALGVSPMLGEPVRVVSECHHCREPLEFPVDPGGPGPEAAGVMVTVAARTPAERRLCRSL
jgi:Alkylmercury lyase